MKPFLIVVVIVFIGAVIFYLIRTRSPLFTDTMKDSRDKQSSRDIAEITRPLNRAALLLRTTDSKSSSYFGGVPPGNNEFDWPTRNGRPLGFLACIDLASIAPDSGLNWLPPDGLLLFFYDMEEQPWGFDPKDRGGWKVLYVSKSSVTSGNSEVPQNLKSEWQVKRRGIEFKSVALPPSWERDEIDALELTDAEMDQLIEFRSNLYGSSPHHQVGGYPDPIQGPDMDLECQLVSNGLYCGDSTGYDDPRAKELGKGAPDWELLLQIDTDDDLDVMWGDVGMLYFWIRREDARNKDFDGTWVILQCH